MRKARLFEIPLVGSYVNPDQTAKWVLTLEDNGTYTTEFYNLNKTYGKDGKLVVRKRFVLKLDVALQWQELKLCRYRPFFTEAERFMHWCGGK